MSLENDDEIEIDRSVPAPVIGIVVIYLLLLAAGLVLMSLLGPPLMRSLAPADLARDLLWGLGLGAALVIVSGVLRARSRLFDALEDVVRERLGGLRLRSILALALLSSLAEELFFRGFLQSFIGELADSPTVGLVVTSLFFGLLHTGPVSRFWPWTLFATGCGFLLGWLWLTTGGLLAPVLVHFLVNAVNMARILDGTAPGDTPTENR